jgi:hypothetical protein
MAVEIATYNVSFVVASRYGYGLWFSTRRPFSSDRVRGVGQRRLARPVLLRQHDLALRLVGRAPPLHVAMQRTALAVLMAAGVLLLLLEQRLGLEHQRRLRPGFDFRPVLLERIRARPPVARLCQVRRQLADGDARSCLAWH